MATRFTLLGTVEGHADGAALALGGSKQKTVLAMMLLANGRSVSVDNLVEAVWGDDPADGAIATLRVFVSNLRRAVSADAADGIRFDGHGYACKFEYELDVFEFDELCRRAAMAPRGKEAAAWRAALAVFAGDPLGGLEHTEPVRRERVRLSEAKLAATDAFFRAELAAGRHREVLSELFVASAEQPLREQLRSALMVALYRSGRQAEALRAYQEYREGLIAELGIEPSPEMRRLEQMVLDQSPELDATEQQVVARAPSTIDVRAANISPRQPGCGSTVRSRPGPRPAGPIHPGLRQSLDPL